MPAASRPAVTDAHLRSAFAAFAWVGWSYEQAMADAVRSRLIKLRARQLCSEQARVLLRNTYACITGHVNAVQTAPGQRFWPVFQHDVKRAAAGDRDD